MLPDSNATDGELVRAVRRGDRRAFETLVRRHLKAAHGVALTKVAREADADDVVQEAFVRALEKLDECREPDRFGAWLLTIVRNHAHNYREYQARRSGAPLERAAHRGDPGSDPERAVRNREIREAMKSALEALTEMQRRVLLLHDYEGWRHAEIARELGFSNGASRFHLSRARKVLRERLGHLAEEV